MTYIVIIAFAIAALIAFVFLVKILVIPLVIVYLKKRVIGYTKKRIVDIAAPITKKTVDNVTKYAKDQIRTLKEKREEEPYAD